MSKEKMEETFRQFDDLVVKVAELHTFAWCVERQAPVLTRSLQGRECCLCRHFVVNGGVCDPL